MPADVEPPELARLIDFAERPRAKRWSMRAALCRYAQPQPERVSAVLDLVRRIEAAVHPHEKLLEREGRDLWAAVNSGEGDGGAPNGHVIELLRVTTELDRLGDVLAAWASDPTSERPDGEVDAVAADVARRLEGLGVPHEERPRPTRQRG